VTVPGGSNVEPWCAKLAEGDADAAWDLFIDRYRRVIIATIRRIVEEDDLLDAFAHVCHKLSNDQLARLKQYDERTPRQARFSTWLVTVVYNLVIDWLRQHRGRRRVTVPRGLTAAQQRIFTCVFVERRSHAEAYEAVRTGAQAEVSFAAFLRDLAETYRIVERSRPRGVMSFFTAPPPPASADATAPDAVEADEMAAILTAAMESLAADERAALQLFVVEDMPAADVARAVGWPNAKAVYNRVYRLLKGLRAALERDGIALSDL
jgi:RNA polymerase sigma factor (sigma-70 family)